MFWLHCHNKSCPLSDSAAFSAKDCVDGGAALLLHNRALITCSSKLLHLAIMLCISLLLYQVIPFCTWLVCMVKCIVKCLYVDTLHTGIAMCDINKYKLSSAEQYFGTKYISVFASRLL